MDNNSQTERARKIRLALERAALFWKIIGDAGVPTSLGMKIGSAKFEALGDDEKFLLAKVAHDLVKADEKVKAAIQGEAQATQTAKEEPPDEKPQEEPEEQKAFFGGRAENPEAAKAHYDIRSAYPAEIEATEVAPAVEIRKARKPAQTT